jgi:hypothetical protein
MDKERHPTKLGFVYKLDLYIDFGRFQAPIQCTLDRKTTRIWWLANMEHTNIQSCGCCVVVFYIVS